MRLLSDFSIRAKLISLATASGGVALLLCCTGFIVNDVSTIRAAKIKELQGQADVLAFNSTAVLTFQDATAAKQLLTSLRLQTSVELGGLYDNQGRVLAAYVKDGCEDIVLPLATQESGHRFTENGHLELSQQVVDEGEFVGTLYLLANMDELHSQLWAYAKIAAIVMFCSLGASLFLSMTLQRTISRPILALAKASKRITSEGDYSIRVEAESKDELGSLCEGFNSMLSKIHSSETALQEANERLEERVSERTAQLEEEITQRKSIQVDLEHSRDAAEAANRAKSEFLANMSHEIRTPMNAILGFTDLLIKGSDGGDETERQEHLEIIHTSGQHLLGLINDILDLSKVEAGKLDIESLRCSPAEIIAEVVSVLRVRAAEKGLTLDSEWPNGVPETIDTDPARLRQLLTNLIGNAIKFTQTGDVTVRVWLRRMEADSQLAIDVVDTGIGIPDEKLDRIFDPFAQADNSVTRRFGGTGLGLAICRRITESLGGTLEVRSEVGKGSVFTATINTGPLEGVKVLDAPPTDALRGARPEQAESSGTLPPARILLVEDGDTNRKLIGLILGRAGANVSMAENGQVGVETATHHPFDLILMDMQMPVMDGYAATRILREQGITVPIIALTAHAMKGDAKECIDAGCSGYLTKPIDSDLLVSTLGKLLCVKGIPPTGDGSKKLPIARQEQGLVSSLPTEDPEFCEIVEEFVERLIEQLALMDQACTAGNLEDLARLTHWLKGAGGTAGFPVLSTTATRIEQLLEEDAIEQIEAAIAELVQLADRIVLPTEKTTEARV